MMVDSKLQSEAEQHPLSALSIGTWYLLPKVRTEVAKWLACRATTIWGNAEWTSVIPKLVADSRNRWRGRYADSRYKAELKAVTNEPVELFTLLEGYLDTITGRSTIGPDGPLKELLVPYILPIDPDHRIGWWFPPRSLRGKGEVAETCYPFFTQNMFSLFAREDAKEKANVVQQPSQASVRIHRFAQGMTSLQTKIVADYDVLDVPSRILDRLVGNGSAILYVIRDMSTGPVGILCIASPIIGLFNRLLTPPARAADSPALDGSVLVCSAHLDDLDYPHAVDCEVNGVQIRICPHCRDRELREACPLFGFSAVVDPLIGDYLCALSRVQRADHVRRHARLEHDLRLPSVLLYSGLTRAPRNTELDRAVLEKLLEVARHLRDCLEFHPDLVDASSGGKADLALVAERVRRIMSGLFQVDVSLTLRGQPRQVFGRPGHWTGVLRCLLENALNAHIDARASSENAAVEMTVDFSDDSSVVVEISNVSKSVLDAEELTTMQRRLQRDDGRAPRQRTLGLEIAARYCRLLRLTPTVRSKQVHDSRYVVVSLKQVHQNG